MRKGRKGQGGQQKEWRRGLGKGDVKEHKEQKGEGAKGEGGGQKEWKRLRWERQGGGCEGKGGQ